MSSSNEEDTEVETKPNKVKKKGRGRPGQPNSVTCNYCGVKFSSKNAVYKHARHCEKNRNTLNKCMWCGLQFTNRGNLATHAFHIHGDTSYKSVEPAVKRLYVCSVCNKSFMENNKLKFHIRKTHFNLKAKVPSAENKAVNQVWFEKVLNSNEIVEIKKAGRNCLILRRTDASLAQVNDNNTNTIDLTHIYPHKQQKDHGRVICDICQKSYLKRDFKKHFEEIHLNKKKHHCNNCNRLFKRAYQYLQHHCNRIKRTCGVRHNQFSDSDLRIVSVESLQVPLG